MANHVSNRMSLLLASQKAFLEQYENPVFRNRDEDPLACDFFVGNPQEMPLPGYADALRRAVEPRDKDWFAYKMSEQPAREAVAASLKAWRGVEYDPEDIFMTNGAFAGLAVIINALVDPGDEVIFLTPPWFFYEALILAANAYPVRVAVDRQTFGLDLTAIAGAITPQTRAIIVNSPNNPTGRIYSPEEQQALAGILTDASRGRERPIYLISDEAYSRIVFDGITFPSPTTFYPHSFLVYTYGKTLLTPGQRIGYIVLPPQMTGRELMRQVLFTSQLVTGYAFPNALLQHALPDLERLSIDVEHLQEKRDRMVGALTGMGYEVHSPQGTFYLLPRSPVQNDLAFIEMLAEEHIYCLPGIALEMPGYFRVSLTASDEMIERSIPGFQRALQKARVTSLVR